MNVAVIGSGGREHAIVWTMAASPRVRAVLAMPGNPGMEAEPSTTCVPVSPSDTEAVVRSCHDYDVELVLIGPEAPLVAGLADTLREEGFLVVGPGRTGAQLEASKDFTRQILERAGVPMAQGATVRTVEEIEAFCDRFDGEALVVKADGLAAGKGVVVCDSVEQARVAARTMITERPFGDACDRIVLEERLDGIETSYIVLTDGTRFAAFPTSQDHKRLLDGDEGPNTGGMGAYTPAGFVDDAMSRRIERDIITPTLEQLRREGIDFRGFLYAGIMLTTAGPKVLEYNVRLGDPEAQVLLASLREDPVDLFIGAARGEMSKTAFGRTRAAAVVVMASEGYPASPRKGDQIKGLEEAASLPDVTVFHAGTTLDASGAVLTNGGRVLGVCAQASSPREALTRAYEGVKTIEWDGVQYRSDIGHHIGDA